MDIKTKISLRKECNFILDNVINLNLSLYPELRYIQNLWSLGIINSVDRFYEEPYDTIVRILPKIIGIINNFPEKSKIGERIKRSNISKGLEKLNLVRRTDDYKIELI